MEIIGIHSFVSFIRSFIQQTEKISFNILLEDVCGCQNMTKRLKKIPGVGTVYFFSWMDSFLCLFLMNNFQYGCNVLDSKMC